MTRERRLTDCQDTLAGSTPSPFLRHTKYAVTPSDVISVSPSGVAKSSRKRRSSEDRAPDLLPPPRPRLAVPSRTDSTASTSSTSYDTKSSAPSTTLVTPEHSVLNPPWGESDRPKAPTPATHSHATVIPSWTPVGPHDKSERFIAILPRCSYQAMLYKKDVKFHVQWQLERELARYPTLSWDDFDPTDFDELQGDAAAAEPNIRQLLDKVAHRKLGDASIISGSDVTAAATLRLRQSKMLQEVDLEERSIRSGDLAGCGQADKFWYGGKIAYTVIVKPASLRSSACLQTAQLNESDRPDGRHVVVDRPARTTAPLHDPENPMGPGSSSRAKTKRLPFIMSLRAPDMPGRSSRLARRFGSRRILNFKLVDFQDGHRNAAIDLFVGRCFILFGRTFRALWAPADRDVVFAVETNDTLPGVTSSGRFLYEPEMVSFNQIFTSGWSWSHRC